jgi:hypothetical protein
MTEAEAWRLFDFLYFFIMPLVVIALHITEAGVDE